MANYDKKYCDIGKNIYLRLKKDQNIKFTGFSVFRNEKMSLNFISEVINNNIKSSKK